MTLIVQNSRTLLKRSQISGATPTVKTGSTQHTDGTWVDTEIYPGELYWNMQDRIMYVGWEDISGNTGTDVLLTGAGTGSCVSDFYTENVFPCNNLLNLILTDGVNYDNQINMYDLGITLQTNILTGGTAYILVEDTNQIGQPLIQLTSDDGSQTSLITIEPNKINLNSGFELEVLPNSIRTVNGSTDMFYSLGANGTTNATPIAIGTIDFSGTTADKVITVNANVNGIDVINNNAYGSKLFAVFKNITGTITQIGGTDKVERSDFTTATSDITISGTDIIIQVTGEAATNINWECNYSYHIS